MFSISTENFIANLNLFSLAKNATPFSRSFLIVDVKCQPANEMGSSIYCKVYSISVGWRLLPQTHKRTHTHINHMITLDLNDNDPNNKIHFFKMENYISTIM